MISNVECFKEIPQMSYAETAVMAPQKLFRQERDWTSSIACLRSITSSINNIGTEDEIVKKYNMCPRSYHSSDIKKLDILKDYIVEFGCDTGKTYGIDKLYQLLKDDYHVMVGCTLNHWLVLMSYFPNNSDDIQDHKLLLYDPCLNEVRYMGGEEFNAMWISGEYIKNKTTKDYIALKHIDE